MSMNGDYRSLAEAVGDAPAAPLAFSAEDLLDAYGPEGPDEDDMAALNEAMDRDMRARCPHCGGSAC